MAIHRFDVEVRGRATLELDDAVINAVTDEWRKKFYQLDTPKEIAAHIAYNLMINGAQLRQLDGWADQPDGNAKLTRLDWAGRFTAVNQKSVEA